MAARRPQEPAGALPALLGARGMGSPRGRPKLGGVFRCVEDAFENKTLPLDALGGGHRGRRGGEPYSGPRGYPGSPSEPGGDGLEAAASLPERPSAAQAHGPQQVVAAVRGLRAAGPVSRERGICPRGTTLPPQRHPGCRPGARPLRRASSPSPRTRALAAGSFPEEPSLSLDLRSLRPPVQPAPPAPHPEAWALLLCVSWSLSVPSVSLQPPSCPQGSWGWPWTVSQ